MIHDSQDPAKANQGITFTTAHDIHRILLFTFPISIFLLLAVSLNVPLSHCNANTQDLLIWICFSQIWTWICYSFFSIHWSSSPSTLRALPDVSAAPDDFMHASLLRRTLIALLNFKVHVPQELPTAITRPSQVSGRLDNRTSALILSSKLIPTNSNWLASVLNSLRCSATLSLSSNFRLNFFIKKTMFDTELCIFDRTAVKSWVVLSGDIECNLRCQG